MKEKILLYILLPFFTIGYTIAAVLNKADDMPTPSEFLSLGSGKEI